MPGIAQHQSTRTTKMLLIANSGGGKSGALASLAAGGFQLRILDTDNGLDVLRNYLTDPNSVYVQRNARCADNVQYVTLTNPSKTVNGRLIPSGATVWPRAMNLLDNWVDGETKLGPITGWDTNTVLVIDTLSTISRAALNYILSMGARLGQRPQLADWGIAQDLVEGLLSKLYDDAVQCNVIVNCHVTYIEADGGSLQGYPATLGKALPPKVGQYFNSALMLRSKGAKRVLLTSTSGVVELKNTAPMRVKPEYPIEWGLLEYFNAVRQQDGISSAGQTKSVEATGGAGTASAEKQ